MKRLTSFHESGPRYPALRTIGWLCTLFGAVLVMIGAGLLISGIYVVATVGVAAPPDHVPLPDPFLSRVIAVLPPVAFFSLVWSFGILLSGLQLIVLGAFCRLMIHLEENTRASAQMLDRIRSRLEASPEGADAIFRS
jgi:hypothetical protein